MAPNVAPGCWAEPARRAFAPPASPATAPIPQLCPQPWALSSGTFTCSWGAHCQPEARAPHLPSRGASPATHTAAQSLSVPHSTSCLVCLRLTLEPPKSLSATCAGPEGFSVSQGSQASSLCPVVSPRTGPKPPVLVKGQTGQDREVGVMETQSSVPASSARRLLVTSPELFILNPRISSLLSPLPTRPPLLPPQLASSSLVRKIFLARPT